MSGLGLPQLALERNFFYRLSGAEAHAPQSLSLGAYFFRRLSGAEAHAPQTVTPGLPTAGCLT